jgi:uncharacterized membrane protein
LVLSGCAAGPADEPDATQILAATVGFVRDTGTVEMAGTTVQNQTIEMILRQPPRRGEIVLMEHRVLLGAGGRLLHEGERVYLHAMSDDDGAARYSVAGYDRTMPLALLAAGFVALVLWVARGKGFWALIGMILSLGIIFGLFLPRVGASADPHWTALGAAAAALPVLYVTAHGFRRETLVAVLASLVGLALTGVLAVGAAALVRLTGYASEEMAFLQAARGPAIDALGLVLAGMIISVLGVLDDITIAQASLVTQLARLERELDWRGLYQRAMHVGRDHIASMVNTLVLVYAGASLPLLLLLGDRSLPLGYVVGQEIIAEEIVRMLVTSSGLVAVVPLATLLAGLTARWRFPGLGAE